MGKRVFAAVLATAILADAGCMAQRAKTEQYLDDSTITGKVSSALMADSTVSKLDIGVETFQGTVQLSGFVDSPKQKHRAEELARSVSGVRNVRNDLQMK